MGRHDARNDHTTTHAMTKQSKQIGGMLPSMQRLDLDSLLLNSGIRV